jgi:linoleate 10R-lipoxygenase
LTPFNLTSWGFHDCQRDPKAFGFGSTLGRLFLRNLPHHFTENSAFTFFPLMTPDSMKTNLTKLELLGQYDLARPKAKKATEVINTHATVASILKDKEGFIAPYKSRVDRVLKGKGYVSSCRVSFVLIKDQILSCRRREGKSSSA